MRKLGLAIAILLVGGFMACQLLLPEGFVVRGPMLNSLLGRGVDAPEPSVVQSRFRAPEGFTVELWAEGVTNARMLRLSPKGALLVSQPRLGRILHVLPDADGDGRSDGHRELVGGLDRPHGLDFHDGHLYVGESGAIARIPVADDGPASIRTTGPVERIVEGIPAGGNHWTRTLRFGPDGGLYLHVGSSCNVCEEEDPRRATLLRYEPDGSGEEIHASGLRNSVGFDWQPGSDRLYATENGRDLLGDDYPPDELNHIVRGGFYGWPHANGDREPDPDFGAANPEKVAISLPPAHAFAAHNAPLGITFLRHPDVAPSLRGAALVALHGSWNRSRLDGYEVVSLHWLPDGSIDERPFLTGFEVDEDVIGRPVDVLEMRDGSILVSDDYAGALYRVHRGAPRAGPSRRVPPAAPTAVADPLGGLTPADREALDRRGAALFQANACGSCHLAEQAAAGVVVKPLENLSARYDIESLAAFFLAPTPPMPAFDRLSIEQRRALAVHLLGRFR